jgi:hypothetical protein
MFPRGWFWFAVSLMEQSCEIIFFNIEQLFKSLLYMGHVWLIYLGFA